MPSSVWDEITYPFPNFSWNLGMDWNFMPHFAGYVHDYLSMLGLRLIHADKTCKRALGYQSWQMNSKHQDDLKIIKFLQAVKCSWFHLFIASGPCFNIWQISYLKISWWLTVARLVVLIVTLIWNLKLTYKTYRILKHLRSRLIVRSRKFFEAARFVFRIVRSLWNGAGTSAVVWWIIHVTNLMSSRLHNILWYDVLSDTWGRTGGLGVNTLRPRQNGRHFPDNIFQCIFLNENEWISIKISLKFVPKDQINNIPSLVSIMAWRRPGDKPLSEAMMASLLTHICVARPRWVKGVGVGGLLKENGLGRSKKKNLNFGRGTRKKK